MTNATLLKKFEELSARVATLEAENTRVTHETLQHKNENQLLRQKLDQYIRHYFGGQRNEGLDKHQLELCCKDCPTSSRCQFRNPNLLPPHDQARRIRFGGC